MSLTKEAARVVVTDTQDQQNKPKPNWGKRIAAGAAVVGGGLALNKFRSGGGFDAVMKGKGIGKAWNRGSALANPLQSSKDYLGSQRKAARAAKSQSAAATGNPEAFKQSIQNMNQQSQPKRSITGRAADAVGRIMDRYTAGNLQYQGSYGR